ncbi:hypothetical protein H0H87_005090, partial [Tephrocybe sp. NHM501043]
KPFHDAQHVPVVINQIRQTQCCPQETHLLQLSLQEDRGVVKERLKDVARDADTDKGKDEGEDG